MTRPNKRGQLEPAKKGNESVKKGTSRGFGRWHFAFMVVFLAVMAHLFAAWYPVFRHTLPEKPKAAECEFKAQDRKFAHCKEKESENRLLLKKIVEAAKDLDASSIADASVNLTLALARRSTDKRHGDDLRKTLTEFIKPVTERIDCIKLIDASTYDFLEETPISVCAVALYKNSGDMGNFGAIEEFNDYNNMMFLMAMYGSQFHEGTMRFTKDGELKLHGEPVVWPQFSGLVYNFYYKLERESLKKYSYLLNQLSRARLSNEHRVATSLLAVELRKSLAAMRRCSIPQGKITWMEYHSRALFKRRLFKGTEDECGWTEAADSYMEIFQTVWYDIQFTIRRLMDDPA